MGFLNSIFGGGFNAGDFARQNLQQPYNAQQVQNQLAQYQQFVNALQGQGGIQNQANVFNQLQGVANGQGPNPAQAMLNQATGQNVANQAALAASQRGSGANAGLLARQAAMQGRTAQQDAAGQAATLQANQSLGALNQLGGIAGQQVAQQGNALGNLLGTVNQGLQAQNQNIASLGGAQAGFQGEQAKGGASMLGGLGAGILALSGGGEVGSASASNQEAAMKENDEPSIIDHLLGYGGEVGMRRGGRVPGKAAVKGDSYRNDKVPAMLSPGEIVVPRSKAKDPSKAAQFAHAVSMRSKKH